MISKSYAGLSLHSSWQFAKSKFAERRVFAMIRELVKKFVHENWKNNRFVKRILLEEPVYWEDSATDIDIVQSLFDVLAYGAALDDKKMKELFEQYRNDVIIYFEDFLDRAGYSDFFVAQPEVPLYKFIMTTVLDDLIYCVGWYVIEQLEQEDYPELQNADCLEIALARLLRILKQEQKKEQEKEKEKLARRIP